MATLVKIHKDGREEMKDGGSLCESIAWNEDGTFKEVVGNRPVVGCSMRVGTPFTRTYANQDWWLTTPVTKILKETKKYVEFETENSTYRLIF
jgi:hypothetical protein